MYNRRCDPIEPLPLPARRKQGAGSTPSYAASASTAEGLAPDEVSVAPLYCALGGADIERVRQNGPAASALIGEEIIGRILARGRAVTQVDVGDIVGIGALAASCRTCEHCRCNLEQYCLAGASRTRDYQQGRWQHAHAGPFASSVVVTERFLIRIPAHADLPATAPLLNAGVAAYSAMQHWKLEAGQRVGVIGMGGLGHIAVMLAAARGARVTVFTTSSHKLRDAVLFGAEQAILWNDELAFERLAGTFDLLISTVPQGYCVGDFMALLKLDGTLVNLGTTADLQHAVGAGVPRGRQSVATSRGGSITDTQSVVDYCVAHGIRPRIELIRADSVQRMIERTPDIEVRYRYVIDFASARHH